MLIWFLLEGRRGRQFPSPSFLCFITTTKKKKPTLPLPSPFFSFLELRSRWHQSEEEKKNRRRQQLLFSSFCFFCFSAELGLVLFCLGSIRAKKKKTTVIVTFFDGFATKNWRHAPFCWFSCEEGDDINVVTFFYGGPDVTKAMAESNFIFFGSLWFSLLKLTINNGRCFVEVEGYNGSEKEIEEK